MIRGSRGKNQQTKRTELPTATEQALRLLPDSASFRADKAIVVSQEDFIRAGAPSCFDLIVGRLEGAIDCDPMIREVKRVSAMRRAGAITQLRLVVAGRRRESPAMVSLCETNRVLVWGLIEPPKVKEYWRLEPEQGGTVVHVILGHEIHGSVIKRLLQSIVGRRRLEQETRQVLGRLKETAEVIGSR